MIYSKSHRQGLKPRLLDPNHCNSLLSPLDTHPWMKKEVGLWRASSSTVLCGLSIEFSKIYKGSGEVGDGLPTSYCSLISSALAHREWRESSWRSPLTWCLHAQTKCGKKQGLDGGAAWRAWAESLSLSSQVVLFYPVVHRLSMEEGPCQGKKDCCLGPESGANVHHYCFVMTFGASGRNALWF